jgi:hypothetical protein
MKPTVFILLTSFICFPLHWQAGAKTYFRSATFSQFRMKRTDGDSSQSVQFINASSLKRLPSVLKDLTVAFNNSTFRDEYLRGGKRFAIYLYDVTCNGFENSAAVRYRVNDTIYHLKLNRYNQLATDKALAATLIHEIMHCVLLDICKRAKEGEEKARASIIGFGLSRNDTTIFFNNEFFGLMNSGDSGQHELIYRLFYTDMVSLLEHFETIHTGIQLDHKYAERLLWSGLQETNGYKKLLDQEKREIELVILKAKGIEIDQE